VTDYLVVGHVTRDVADGRGRPGGTVLYAGLLAVRWGLKVGILTSAEPAWVEGAVFGQVPELRAERTGISGEFYLYESPTGKVRWAVRAAPETTTFENIYTPTGRRQRLLARAGGLSPQDLPADWGSKVLHLGPVADEVAPTAEWVRLGPRFLGCTPQGWLRRFGPDGTAASRWRPEVGSLLEISDGVVLSAEDLGPDLGLVERLGRLARCLVITRAEAGADLWVAGRHYYIPALVRPAVDPTGAGDVFAAAFFIRLEAGDDPVVAARVAAAAAALKVGRLGPNGVPGWEAVEAELGRSLKSCKQVSRKGDNHGRD